MSRFATLDSLRKKEAGDEGKQSFYAGGAGESGGSGVNVYGGNRAGGNDQVNKIFDAANKNSAAGGGDESKASDGDATTITFWSNGFQVNDGPFRDNDAPENKAFLADIAKGYVPRELREKGAGVKVAVKDKRSEEYKPPPPPAYTAFSGAGNSMDTGADDVGGAAIGVAGGGASAEFSVDEAKPTTNVRVRLATGKRQVLKFNTTHTVGDLLAQVASVAGDAGAFTLMAGFPPKPLEDVGATLEAAGLLNSQVIMNML